MLRSHWMFRGLLFSVVALLAAGGLTLGQSNLTSTDGPATSQPHATSQPTLSPAAKAALAAKAQAIYQAHCFRCHRAAQARWVVAGQPLRSPLYIYCTKTNDRKHLLTPADQKVVFDWITSLADSSTSQPNTTWQPPVQIPPVGPRPGLNLRPLPPVITQ